METRMEVAQLESRMETEDYRKLQGLFAVGSRVTPLTVRSCCHGYIRPTPASWKLQDAYAEGGQGAEPSALTAMVLLSLAI